MRGLQLILMIRSMLSKLNISLADLFELFEKIMAIGAPPEIGEEENFRAWLVKISDVVGDISIMTPIELDDLLAKFMKTSLASDAAWKIFYKLLSMMLQRADGTMGDFEFQNSVTVTANDLSKVLAEENAAIDPVTIITLIKLILDIIRNWKK